MKNLFEQVEKIPDSAMTDVTQNTPASTATASTGVIDEKEAFLGTEHTKISPLTIPPSNTPGNAGNVPQNAFAGAPGSHVSLGNMVDGKIAIEMMDALLPGLLVALLHYMKISMKKSELQLTESEKKTIAPIFHECLKTINFNFTNPWVALSVTVGVIYGSKVTEKGIVAWIDKRNEQSELKNMVVTGNGELINRHAEIVQPNAQQQTAVVSQMQQTANNTRKRPSSEKEVFDAVIAETFLEKGYDPVPLVFTERQIKDMVNKRRISRKEAVRALTMQYIKSKNKK